MSFWARSAGVTLHFIQPDNPIQNAFIEGFNSEFRGYCQRRADAHSGDNALEYVQVDVASAHNSDDFLALELFLT